MILESRIPMPPSSANALRQWLSRALAFSPCARSIDRAARLASLFAPLDTNPNPSTNAAAAVRTWHTVHARFFPPKRASRLRKKQKTPSTPRMVPLQPQVTPTFPVVKTHLRFAILKAALHVPPCQPHQKQRVRGCLRRRVAHEVLDLLPIPHVAGRNQFQARSRQIVLVLERDRDPLRLPDHRPFVAVLDVVGLPGLRQERGTGEQMVLQTHRLRTARNQPGDLARATFSPFAVGPTRDRGPRDPARQRSGDLAHEPLVARDQAVEESWLAAVVLIEGDPSENQPVAAGDVVQLQADLPLGPVDQRLGNPCGATPGSVLAPHFGQEEFAVQQAVERSLGQRQVNRDDAIVILAGGPAVLVLNSGGLVPLLGTTGLVEHTNDSRTAMPGGDPLLESIAHQEVVPLGQGQELLQGFGGHVGGHGDGLDALSGQVGELPLDINAEMMSCSIIDEALIEESEELLNSRAQGQDLVGGHRRMAPTKALPTRLWQPPEIESIIR